MDLRGLAALFGKINALLTARHEANEEINSLDLFGLSRFLERRGESGRAQAACSAALNLGLPVEFRPKACRSLALLAKRRGEHDRAATLWHELATDPQNGVFACEQLAIFYERQEREFTRALEFAHLGLAKIERLRLDLRDPYSAARMARLAEKFLSRIGRLDHRIEAANGL